MSSPDPADRDRLLEQVLSGELDASAPAVRRALDADPSLRAELDELRWAQAALGAAGAEERAVLREAGAAGAPAPRVDVVRLVGDLAAGTDRAPPPRFPGRHSTLLAAAALLVAVTAAWLLWPERGAADPIRLGGDLVLGEVIRMPDLGLRLSWSAAASAGEYYRARIESIPGGATLAETEDRLYQPTWNLAPEPGADLRGQVRVVISVHGADRRPRTVRAFTVDLPR